MRDILSALCIALAGATACSGSDTPRLTDSAPPTGVRRLSEDQIPEKPTEPTKPARMLSLNDARRRLWPREHSDTFETTTTRERAAVQRLIDPLVAALAQSESLPALHDIADELGLKLEEWVIEGVTLWVLVEPDSRRRGGGIYLFRRDAAVLSERPLRVLQAPHSYYDTRTGRLALTLLVRGSADARPDALFANSMHRYGRPGSEIPVTPVPTDLSHNPNHLFSAMTDTLARTHGRAQVVQLHGFARLKTKEGEKEEKDKMTEPAVEAIVSAGLRERSSVRARSTAQALRSVLQEVRVFPEEVDQLGATTNVQGKLLRMVPRSSFVHVELSKDTRDRLANDPALLDRLGAGLWVWSHALPQEHTDR